MDEVREMASLTKMMTGILAIELATELKLNLHKTWFKVSAYAASMTGTTAGLIDVLVRLKLKLLMRRLAA